MTASRVDYAHHRIILSSAFMKKAFVPGTDEYEKLQTVRKDFPDFTLAVRKFKKNASQEHYRGLDYDFMRDYIRDHEADPKPVLNELEEKIGVSKAHSLGKRYPIIKAWFLDRYPEIREFGMPKEAETAEATSLDPEVEELTAA